MLESPDTLKGAWSAFYEGALIVIGGGVIVEKSIGGWMLFTDRITPKGFMALHRILGKIIKHYETQGFTMFVHIDSTYSKAVRWAGLMGFKLVKEEKVQGKLLQRFERWH